MSNNFKKYYEEYQQVFHQKTSESNSNRESGREKNIQTNKNKSCKKENTIVPFGFGSIDNNEKEHIHLKNEINMIEKKSFYLKSKKFLKPSKNIFIGTKEFYKKNGKSERFNLFSEKEIKLNIFDTKTTNILSSEEDYDSDDMIVKDGTKKAEEDLIEAVENVKKYSFKDIYNYQKYKINYKI